MRPSPRSCFYTNLLVLKLPLNVWIYHTYTDCVSCLLTRAKHSRTNKKRRQNDHIYLLRSVYYNVWSKQHSCILGWYVSKALQLTFSLLKSVKDKKKAFAIVEKKSLKWSCVRQNMLCKSIALVSYHCLKAAKTQWNFTWKIDNQSINCFRFASI